jgi:hypothetical protein
MMPKKNGLRATEPAEDAQRLYARAYASRLAKQVTEELDSSRSPRAIIQSGWDGADRRSSSGSPSPLRSPAACHG